MKLLDPVEWPITLVNPKLVPLLLAMSMALSLLLCSCTPQAPADRVLDAISRAKQACGVYEVMTDIPRDARVDQACEALLRVEVRP